jgi:crossover junction endodeoxyribonuclease RuvC
MVILGIDPGTTRVGYAIIKLEDKKIIPQTHGCLFFENISADERPGAMLTGVKKLIKEYVPDVVALEKIFFSKNKKTAIAVAESRGAAAAIVTDLGIPLFSYTPSEVKSSIGATPASGKAGVQKMIKLILNLSEVPKPDDAADALALAVCCAHNSGKLYFKKVF